jgi:hypothetical protein
MVYSRPIWSDNQPKNGFCGGGANNSHDMTNTRGLNHGSDRPDGQRRARAKPRRGHAGGKTAPPRKPFERIALFSPQDDARTYSAWQSPKKSRPKGHESND